MQSETSCLKHIPCVMMHNLYEVCQIIQTVMQCNNQRSVGYASGEVICWNWDGHWPTCCCSLCSRGMKDYSYFFTVINN